MEVLIMKALAKDPEERFQRIGDMHRAIEEIHGDLGFMAQRLSASVRAAKIQLDFEKGEMCHEVATVDLEARTA
jgi:hypothetical protein